jgi:hypothetical protein
MTDSNPGHPLMARRTRALDRPHVLADGRRRVGGARRPVAPEDRSTVALVNVHAVLP